MDIATRVLGSIHLLETDRQSLLQIIFMSRGDCSDEARRRAEKLIREKQEELLTQFEQEVRNESQISA
jgi:hypothetical protein